MGWVAVALIDLLYFVLWVLISNIFPCHELKKPWSREGLWVPQVDLSGLISGRWHQGYNDLPEATHQRGQSWDQDLKSLNEPNTWLQPSDRQASPCTQALPLFLCKRLTYKSSRALLTGGHCGLSRNSNSKSSICRKTVISLTGSRPVGTTQARGLKL